MRIATWLLSLLGFVTACGQHNYENADVNEFASLLTGRQDVVLLDVRTAEEYAEGHIEGAMNIDVRSDSMTISSSISASVSSSSTSEPPPAQ